MPERVHAWAVGCDGGGDGRDVGGELAGRVAARVRSTLALMLPAHVDRDHTAVRQRERVEHGDEVFLAAGKAREQQRWSSLAYAAGGLRRRKLEQATTALNR